VRIAVGGWPRCGKTTLASKLGMPTLHTDDLIDTGLTWSEQSTKVMHWIEDAKNDDHVIEGVAMGRALRKWLEAHKYGRPVDELYWLYRPFTKLTPHQLAMGRGCETVFAKIRPALMKRGVTIHHGLSIGDLT